MLALLPKFGHHCTVQTGSLQAGPNYWPVCPWAQLACTSAKAVEYVHTATTGSNSQIICWQDQAQLGLAFAAGGVLLQPRCR